MHYFLIGLGLAIVIEGALYALFPGPMKRMLVQALAAPESQLRWAGLAAVIGGAVLVWWVMPTSGGP